MAIALLTLVTSANRAPAQLRGGEEETRSTTAARAAWTRARAAMQADDAKQARIEVDRAMSEWPGHPQYLWARAVIAAAGADTTTAQESLEAYEKLGLGRDVGAVKEFAPYLSLPAFADVTARLNRNRARLSAGETAFQLPDSTFWPEAIAYNSRNGSYYVSSVRHGTIAEVSRNAPPRELLARHMKGMGAILAVRYDSTRDVLWAATTGIPAMESYVPADSSLAALLMIRPRDGAIEARFDLPAGEPHILGDLAITVAGDVLISDSRTPKLYVLRHGSHAFEELRHPLFRSLQGLAVSDDPDVIYVADYSNGLLRVELSHSQLTRVTDTPVATTIGLDGIAYHRGRIIGVQNGFSPARVVIFSLDPAGMRIVAQKTLERSGAEEEPTNGLIVGNDFVFVANSQWNSHTEDGVLKQGVMLRRPEIRRIHITDTLK